MTKPASEMSFSDCVNASLEKGWGVGDERKMMKAFALTRPMADKVASVAGTYGSKAPLK